MGRALYEWVAAVQKPVWLPVKIDAGMRTVIEVIINVVFVAYDKKFNLMSGLVEPETPGQLVRDINQGANIVQVHHVDLLMQGDFHGVNYLLSQPGPVRTVGNDMFLVDLNFYSQVFSCSIPFSESSSQAVGTSPVRIIPAHNQSPGGISEDGLEIAAQCLLAWSLRVIEQTDIGPAQFPSEFAGEGVYGKMQNGFAVFRDFPDCIFQVRPVGVIVIIKDLCF